MDNTYLNCTLKRSNAAKLVIYLMVGVSFFLLGQNAFAQNDIEVIEFKGIEGNEIGNDDITIRQLKERALANAKLEALRLAGIEERIQVVQEYYVSETSTKEFHDYFINNTLIQMRGAVQNVEIISGELKIDEFGDPTYSIQINAEVVKYNTDINHNLKARVEGLSKTYNSGDLLSFELIPASDLFLYVFWLGQSEMGQIFPNELEKPRLFKAGERVSFPTKQYLEYEMETKESVEEHRLIFVYLYEQVVYTGDLKYEEIIDWLVGIPQHKRNMENYSILIGE